MTKPKVHDIEKVTMVPETPPEPDPYRFIVYGYDPYNGVWGIHTERYAEIKDARKAAKELQEYDSWTNVMICRLPQWEGKGAS